MIDASVESGVENGDVLIALADAMTGDDANALALARDALIESMGTDAVVEAVGVVSNFERMVRIADGTGIPLDGFLAGATQELREELGLNAFAAAAYTKDAL